MSHTHHCEVCKIAVAICSDAACEAAPAEGQEPHPNHGRHYCAVHQPVDSPHRVEVAPPPPRYAVLVKEQS